MMLAQQDSKPGVNRRGAPRYRIEAPGTLWLDVGWQQVICRDISRTGAGLTVCRPDLSDLLVFPRQSRDTLRFTVQLPDGDLDLRGTLAHRGSDRLGLRFGDLGPSARARLDAMTAQ